MSSTSTKRPLSPHLSIYKPIPTMVMSIMHRITGVALYTGTLLVAWWLIAAASSEAYFNWVNGFFASWFGILVMFGYTWALVLHMLGGIRHFIWDTGALMDKHTSTKLAYASMIASIVITVLIWIVGFSVT
ncbi:succinate dehydrogenase, cytochrome b556 subunit [Ahrensia sp. 13_GOM-1096m]|uniref:succinate dehydrogenase, cytochrome b556 subunit n=1 Tax=Ahrensia sp. 13_GOM-1096m TaxID=1380380 RepID=UPI000479445E|nr:succinate dehydrogenase, cytochrome b556 subunit [Ahrensia sp. 13_GOM-1096m]